MINVTLQELDKRLAQIGRGVVLIGVKEAYTPPDAPEVGDTERWDPTGPLRLAHLGNTEGEIEVAPDVAMSALTFPEYTGPLEHDRFYDGESVTLTLPMFFADPRLMAVASPVGSASGGYGRQRRVKEHTVVVVPEQLLATASGFGALTYDGDWEVGGLALSEEQERLLGLSVWFWRGSFGRQLPAYLHPDGGKLIRPVEFTPMYHPDMPDGHRAYTVGDPIVSGIDLLGES